MSASLYAVLALSGFLWNAGMVLAQNGNGPSVRFEQSQYTVSEGETLTFRLIALGTFEFNFSVSVVLLSSDSSVVLGEDYEPTDNPTSDTIVLTFTSGSSISSVGSVSILKNTAWELTERFRMRLRVPTGVRKDNPSIATVKILDTNQVHVSFPKESYSISEGIGNFSLSMLADGNYSLGFSVSVRCLELNPVEAAIGSSDGQDIDVVGQSHIGNFATLNQPQSFSSPITLSVVNDQVAEPTETFICAILRPFSSQGVVVSDPDTITVVIEDDDVVSVQFVQPLYEGAEEGTVEVQLEALLNYTQSFSAEIFAYTLPVDHQYKDVEADPSDYQVVEQLGMVVFDPPSLLSSTLTLNLFDDELFEKKEYFGLAFTFVDLGFENSLKQVVGPRGTSLVSIEDKNTILRVQVEQEVITVQPGDTSVNITLETVKPDPLSPSQLIPANHSVAFGVDVLANVTFSRGGVEYEMVSSVATFFPGNTTSTVLTLPFGSDVEEFTVQTSLPDLGELNGRIQVPTSPVTVRIQVEQTDSRVRGNLTFVNDSIVGDPLFTIPLSNDPLENPELEGVSLCMDFKGLSDKYYNLVSDSCTTVNAHYAQGLRNPRLHVIDEVGVKTEGEGGQCHQVLVSLDQCKTFVDGSEISGMVKVDGLTVVVAPQHRRTRISLPNCSPGKELVMWVSCDTIGSGNLTDGMLQYTLSRAVGLDPTSHGLIGQFWNVHVNYAKYSGHYGREEVTKDDTIYSITIDSPGPRSEKRTFLGEFQGRNWLHSSGAKCIFAGNSLGGKSLEQGLLFSSVIEGKHHDYELSDLFDSDFKFSRYTSSC